jgi:hypothetical protein
MGAEDREKDDTVQTKDSRFRIIRAGVREEERVREVGVARNREGECGAAYHTIVSEGIKPAHRRTVEGQIRQEGRADDTEKDVSEGVEEVTGGDRGGSP